MNQILQALSQVLPQGARLFSGQEAGRGDPSIFRAFSAQVIRKNEVLIKQGENQKAQEMAVALLAAYPLEKTAGLHLMQVLGRCGNILEGYRLGKLYATLFPEDQDFFRLMAEYLRILAMHCDDDAQAMGLLDGAALLDPALPRVWSDLANRLQLLDQRDALERTRQWAASFKPQISCMNSVGSLNSTHGKRIRVWYVSHSFGFEAGGINGVSQAKSMTLSSIIRGGDGPEVSVITPLRPELPEAMGEFAQTLPRITKGDGFSWPLWQGTTTLPQGGIRFCRPEDGGKPDLVIVEGLRLTAHHYLERLGFPDNCPKVFIHHSSPDHFTDKYRGEQELPATLEALAKYDGFVCVSSNVIEEWKRFETLAAKPWVHIPNCAREEEAADLLKIDPGRLREKLGLPQDGFIGLCLASVQWRKGQDILLQQLREVTHKRPDALFIFVGPIFTEWGGQQIMELGNKFLQKHVRFLGVQLNALEYIHASDCLVLPSREEALPLTILEAMCLGKTSVASDVNGIPELIEDKVTGLLFSHDNPRQLAKHLLTLIDNPVQAQHLGKQALNRYHTLFSRKQHAMRWRESIEMLVAQNKEKNP
ncbi:glycosyltransferase family 4 protein [Desulfonatronum lacustre]|uniref:glycosyltransferase family 4 protein n=1 Tax=Desulfonatronum lacustre TaxID=66849 RepID=UPI00048C1565|nr:glycosyltransferase family 4 protein [Desulfonatronum lacustre]